MMRLAPICFAKVVIGVMKPTVTPSLSISLLIVAPLRVSVPQVDTSKTPSTFSAFMSRTISLPILSISAIAPLTPVVE